MIQLGTIGKNIKIARTRLGLNQSQLAQMAGITKAAISRYEAGLREPRIEHLRAIANALDVSVGFLEGYEDINSKKVMDAMKHRDSESIEKLMGLSSGSVKFLPPEEENLLKRKVEEDRQERDRLLSRLKLLFKFQFRTLTEKDCNEITDLIRPFSQLNEEGRKRAIERVEELTEIPKYQKEPQTPDGEDDEDPYQRGYEDGYAQAEDDILRQPDDWDDI